MTGLRVLPMNAARLSHAEALVFEYLASTQGERGRPIPIPGTIDELPGVLRAECADLTGTYRAPGVLLIAYRDQDPAGCVGLTPASDRGWSRSSAATYAPRGGVRALPTA